MLRPNEVVIHDGNYKAFCRNPRIGGEQKKRGLVPRDYEKHPVGSYACAPALHAVPDFKLIDQSEWSGLLKDKIARKALLSDIRLTGNNGGVIPALDQNGKGYCWAHSSTSAVMMARAKMNAPYVGLSAYAIACLVKNYRDEGGWGAESMDFIAKRGVPSEAFWPMKSMSKSNDKPETWANAALHMVVDQWVDLQTAQYDRKYSFAQEGTLLLTDNPVVKDENWWSHSICGLDLVEGATVFDAGQSRSPRSGKKLTVVQHAKIWESDPVTAGFGVRILNSWGCTWSDRGMGVLAGSKAVSDGAVAPRIIKASPA